VDRRERHSATGEGRIELTRRLRSRREEIEGRIFAIVEAVPGAGVSEPLDYVRGLRSTIQEVLDLALSALEGRQDLEQLSPLAAVAQARRAARVGVPLSAVMRRYAAGDRTLGLLVAEESRDLPAGVLPDAQRALSSTVDRLMAVVAEEYSLERARLAKAPRDRTAAEVRRILRGDADSDTVAGYTLDLWHVGLVCEVGIRTDDLRGAARAAGCRLLVVTGEGERTWAWLGSRESLDFDLILKPLGEVAAKRDSAIGLGEARPGIDGWRLSHEEAQGAFEVPLTKKAPVVRARDVLMTMAVLRDSVLRRSLFASFVEPLDNGRPGSADELRQTLLSYLAVGQSIKPVTVLLGIDRHTVQRRLRISESLIGRSIEDCAAELQTALRAERMLAEADDPERYSTKA
jgi:hypothetical protein